MTCSPILGWLARALIPLAFSGSVAPQRVLTVDIAHGPGANDKSLQAAVDDSASDPVGGRAPFHASRAQEQEPAAERGGVFAVLRSQADWVASNDRWGREVVRLPDDDVLALFQRIWRECPRGTWDQRFEGPDATARWFEAQPSVLARLEGFYRECCESEVAAPKTWSELATILPDYIDGLGGQARVGRGSVRLIQDREVVLLLVDSEHAMRYPERWSFAVTQEVAWVRDDAARVAPPELPAGIAEIGTSNAGGGWTLCLLDPPEPIMLESWGEEQRPARLAILWQGVRVPEVSERLPEMPLGDLTHIDAPLDSRALVALRAALICQPDLTEALRRVGRVGGLSACLWALGDVDHNQESALREAWAALEAAPEASDSPWELRQDPPWMDEHAFGFPNSQCDPVLFVDDVWVSEHPALAESLFRWISHWDPEDQEWRAAVPLRKPMEVEWFGAFEPLIQLDGTADALVADPAGDRVWAAVGTEVRVIEGGTLSRSFDLGSVILSMASGAAGPVCLVAGKGEARFLVMMGDEGPSEPSPVVLRLAQGAPAIPLEGAVARAYTPFGDGGALLLDDGRVLLLDRDSAVCAVIVTGAEDLRSVAVWSEWDERFEVMHHRLALLGRRRLLLVSPEPQPDGHFASEVRWAVDFASVGAGADGGLVLGRPGGRVVRFRPGELPSVSVDVAAAEPEIGEPPTRPASGDREAFGAWRIAMRGWQQKRAQAAAAVPRSWAVDGVACASLEEVAAALQAIAVDSSRRRRATTGQWFLPRIRIETKGVASYADAEALDDLAWQQGFSEISTVGGSTGGGLPFFDDGLLRAEDKD